MKGRTLSMACHLHPAGCRGSCFAGHALLLVSLIALVGSAAAVAAPPAPDPCTGATNIVTDGGFEAEAPAYAPLSCPCPLISPWVVEQSGMGGATAGSGWGTNGSYAAVLSLDNSTAGDWVSISQKVSGAYYCSVGLTYSTWLSGGRESDLFVYLDDTLILTNHEREQGRQPHIKKLSVGIALSSFTGTHNLTFLQRATTNGTGHSDWFIDDVRLMTGPLPAEPAVTRPDQANVTWARSTISPAVTPDRYVSRPPITKTAPFNPILFLSCLARRIHDEVFPFIPLKQGVDPGCT